MNSSSKSGDKDDSFWMTDLSVLAKLEFYVPEHSRIRQPNRYWNAKFRFFAAIILILMLLKIIKPLTGIILLLVLTGYVYVGHKQETINVKPNSFRRNRVSGKNAVETDFLVGSGSGQKKSSNKKNHNNNNNVRGGDHNKTKKVAANGPKSNPRRPYPANVPSSMKVHTNNGKNNVDEDVVVGTNGYGQVQHTQHMSSVRPVVFKSEQQQTNRYQRFYRPDEQQYTVNYAPAPVDEDNIRLLTDKIDNNINNNGISSGTVIKKFLARNPTPDETKMFKSSNNNNFMLVAEQKNYQRKQIEEGHQVNYANEDPVIDDPLNHTNSNKSTNNDNGSNITGQQFTLLTNNKKTFLKMDSGISKTNGGGGGSSTNISTSATSCDNRVIKLRQGATGKHIYSGLGKGRKVKFVAQGASKPSLKYDADKLQLQRLAKNQEFEFSMRQENRDSAKNTLMTM